jgi:hypothetical protein
MSAAREPKSARFSPAAPAAAVFGLAVAAVATLAVIQSTAPSGRPAWVRLPMAAAEAERANDLVDAAWPSRDRAQLLAARSATLRELSLSPASGAAWLRLSVIASALAGGADQEALTALSRSYAVAPLDVRLLQSRVRASYEIWPALTPGLRRQTLDQIERAWRRPEHRSALIRALDQTANPSGRLALRAKLVALSRKDRVERRRLRALTASPAKP